MNSTPTPEDRVWAVLSHMSALAFGMGIVLPVIGWSEHRRKSKYASFQCLQALGYQSLGFTVWLLTYLLIFILLMILFIIAVSAAGDESNLIRMWTSIFAFVTFSSFGIYVLLPIVAAISCGLGRDFRYPFMGDRLAKYLGYEYKQDEAERLNEDHQDRWVAAMGHFSVIIALWGLLAPLTTWIVRGKDSLFLKFQSVQTAAYQGIVTLLTAGAAVIYMFGFIVFLGLTGFEGNSNGSITSTSMLGLVFLIVTMLVTMLVILIVPLFHILGQWAGYRVLKGDNYRYPFIGRLTERWMANQTELTADGGSSLQTRVTSGKEKTS